MNAKLDREDRDPLAGTQFSHLPEVFAMRDDDGSPNGRIFQEREPCYECLSAGFYGGGVQGTYYPEGSIVVGHLPPNDQLMPLNRAAALRYIAWQESLPVDKVQLVSGDLLEAATMLDGQPEYAKLSKEDKQRAIRKLAIELKARREGVNGLNLALPEMGHNFVKAGQGKAPPILGAKVSDMGQRMPGETRIATSIPGGHAGPSVRRGAAAPMGGR